MKEHDVDNLKNPNILIIDDDKDDTSMLVSAINKVLPKANIKTFSNSSDATDFLYKDNIILKEFYPDLIFLDLNMTKLDGRAVLCLIKVDKKLSDIPVFILSTSTDDSEKKELLNLGASEFFSKPTRDSDLVEIVEIVKSTWMLTQQKNSSK